MKVLLTGFEAFAGNETNPTKELVLSFSQREEVRTTVLPVSFEHAWKDLEKVIEDFKPNWIISCGVASKRETIDLERVALNFMDSSIADNDGERFVEEVISPQLPPCFMNDLPLNEWRKKLAIKRGVNVSLSAGSYVCNYLYFQLMAHRNIHHYQCLFIHFPYAVNQDQLEDFKLFLSELLGILHTYHSHQLRLEKATSTKLALGK